MKKFLRFIIFSILGWLTFKIVKLVLKLSDFSKSVIFGELVDPLTENKFSDRSYAMICSALNLDLTEIKLVDNKAELKLYARFSAIDITVPRNWNVDIQGESKNCGIDENTEFDSENENAPLLKINYDLKYCGVKIGYTDSEEVESE